jgi:cell division transport system permease protein
MMFDRIEFLLSEAFTALRRNTLMTFAAVSTAAMALFLLGGLGYTYFRLNTWLHELKKDYQIRVFLRDDLTQAETASAKQTILNIPGVAACIYVSKEQGLKEVQSQMPNVDLQDLAADNPLPNTFRVTLSSLDQVDQITKTLKTKDFLESEDGVRASNELREFVEAGVKQSRMLGIVLGGIMFITGGVLIFNAIRLTIEARKREMKIQELVGATRSTILTPLLIEGICHGAMGGALAVLFLYVTTQVSKGIVQSLDALAKFEDIPLLPALGFFLAAGAIYGFGCSWLATRKLGRQL